MARGLSSRDASVGLSSGLGSSVRQKSNFAHRIAWLIGFALLPGHAFAQAPAREGSPFDWLRHDAAPTNRSAGATIFPPTESLNDQKKRQQIEPLMEEAAPVSAPSVEEAVSREPPPSEIFKVDVAEPAIPAIEASLERAAPGPVARPSATATNHPSAKAKPAAAMERIDVINNRSVILNELKLVSLKEGRKPFIVKPSLKPGHSLSVEIPREWGCLFLVWTQFSEEPSEQYDGVDLCGDRKINLIN